MFAKVVAMRDREPEPVAPQASPEPQAEPGTDDPAQTPSVEEPDPNLTEPKPEAGGDEPKTEGADGTDLSQTEDKTFKEALAGLNEDAKASLIEVAQAIAKGETTLGEVKRRMKLGRQENEELTQLRQEVERLKTAPPAVKSAAPIPETVLKLKTLEEVEARSELADTSIRAIEDFLEENPSGGVIGDKEFTRAELIQRKRLFQDELKALPKQAQALQQRDQFNQVKTEARKQILADFPVLNDPENPDTKAAQSLLKSDPVINQYPNADYLALALARGHRELQAELAARKGGKPAAKPAAKPAGVVAPGKPHQGAAAPARSQNGAAPVGDLLKGVKDKVSFAELLAATGR